MQPAQLPGLKNINDLEFFVGVHFEIIIDDLVVYVQRLFGENDTEKTILKGCGYSCCGA